MKQNIDIEEFIKRLFRKGLYPYERSILNEQPVIGEKLSNIWKETSMSYNNNKKGNRIWNNIYRQITNRNKNTAMYRLNKYSLIASFALLIICGTLLLALYSTTTGKPSETWYVMKIGRQSMDSVKLSDGTLVMMNAGSRLTYPSNFSGKNREVQLSGQAFFQVSKDKNHPFIVKTRNIDITAMGTAFEVFSFDDDSKVETILLNGKVQVETKNTDNRNNDRKYILLPNEKLAYNRASNKVKIETVDADSYSAWRNGQRLSFRNEKLTMILPRLEKWYGQKIYCNSQTADYYQFTFTVSAEPLNDILSYMARSAKITFKEIEKDKFVITKK